MKVEIVISDHVETGSAFSRPKFFRKDFARIVLPTTDDETASDLINFAESGFEMSVAPQPASNYHAGLRQMFKGICDANVFFGEMQVTASIVK